MEIWKEYKEGLYISNFGNIVRDYYKNNSFNPHLIIYKVDKSGYIGFNYKNKRYLLHKIIAELFIPNDNNDFNQIDHIDRNKLNNHYTNLRWVNSSINNLNRNKFFHKNNNELKYILKNGNKYYVRISIKKYNRISKSFYNLEEAKNYRDNIIRKLL